MRTTIRLDDALLAQAKQRAATTGRTLTAVIEDALRRDLIATDEPAAAARLPTSGSGGTLPGVDLDDGAALLELMDEP